METSFFQFNLGHVLEFGAIAIGYASYRLDRAKELKYQKGLRASEMAEQQRMHDQNRADLTHLTTFADEQRKLNAKRDEQVSLLAQQTATFQEMARGFHRRLEMLENRRT